MSLSPPIRRLSGASSASSSKREEDLINAYEAEEERIINVLSRKLEKVRPLSDRQTHNHLFSTRHNASQLQEEKIELENALEAESESHVNRLSRELSALRLAQQLANQQNGGSPRLGGAGLNGDGTQSPTLPRLPNPLAPSSEDMLDAMRRENEQLRNRLVDTEREFIRISRLNEIYREELIQHRRRLGLPVDNLIGLSAQDPYFQPTHRRSSSSASSPSTSVAPPIGAHPVRASPSVAIPRPPSQVHRPPANATSESTTPLSHSPSSASDSPYLSPSLSLSTHPASFATAATTPPSSSAPRVVSMTIAPQPLSYPSVPPPSLSSSYAGPDSPVEHRGSRWRHGSLHDLHQASRSASRHQSVERGARVAETGQLVPRSRAGSIVPGSTRPPSVSIAPAEVGLSTSS
ncbi:hypothetical protein F5148DRAFT_1201549 [Russula earlei]|uniref:Uncharacterized protein n=1 Tax=Russula earlei TaxID=71964 RepID=A0ACC0U8A3_9AGAM|nr:hypothetical protein F5148DRAFT_1201549 [Russula earlei]